MNNSSMLDQVMVAVPFVSFFMAIIIPAYPLFEDTNKALKEHDAEREDPEYERQAIKKYLSGFDYV